MAKDTPNSPRRALLRVLRALLREPARYNIGTLADHLGMSYSRVRDAVEDIRAEFEVQSDEGHLLTVVLPGDN